MAHGRGGERDASREISGRPHARWKVGALTANTGDRGFPWASPTPLKNILWMAKLVRPNTTKRCVLQSTDC